ncbi:hypothetical protein N1F78_11430 [Seonamhaeicola sp. MEBiC1930]|uniref:hypothetical protein n=1 Tax=Seonamhaeicola sp. MEBiC01930 TaxID=2976768 RepID=UPI00324BDFCD
MKKITFILLVLLLAITSCSKDNIEIVGVEISGTYSLNGTYMLDKTYTKGPKYVNTLDESKRLITYNDEGTEMWGLMYTNILYYKIEANGEYPPKSDWECGIGADKDAFKCELIID